MFDPHGFGQKSDPRHPLHGSGELTMIFDQWVLATGIYAAGQIGWLMALDGIIDPSLRRIMGRVLRIRVDSVQSRAGPFSVRAWSTPPPDRDKRPVVALSGALSVLVTAAMPTILLLVVAAHLPLSSRVSATLTLMAVLSYPLVVAARLLTTREES
jgi:hypothetical protein